MLDDTFAQNHRTRQLLQRITLALKEYEALQSNLMKSLGLPLRNLPPELLDAFSHDPSSMTAGTRRHRGWRAVEDIHARLARQRETFQIFMEVAAESRIFPEPTSGLNQSITTLLRSLETLENRRISAVLRAQEVVQVSARVKSIHANVKAEYNNTVSHTSVVYPEVSVNFPFYCQPVNSCILPISFLKSLH
jgi:hypothetical protein